MLATTITPLRGPRVVLRAWRKEDLAACAAMNADPEVMRYFPAPLTSAENDIMVQRIIAHFAQHGFGLWVLEIPGVLPFAGFVGLLQVGFNAHFTPAVEVGWRLVRSAWGNGYATEAAQCALQHAFMTLQLKKIVSLTVPANKRSQAVMHRLGMVSRVQDTFEHPRLPNGHPLRLHLLYRLTREDWLAQRYGRASRYVTIRDNT